MEGKTCLITGGSDGIGYAASHELARLGARVVMVGRNAVKTDAAVQRIISETGNPAVERLLADLSSQREVRRVAAEALERLPRLDVLFNNAGAVFKPGSRSVDGIEMTFALNHLGYFLLTALLLERLRQSAPARIINVSSGTHDTTGKFRLEDLPKPGGRTGPLQFVPSGGGFRNYARSKLCNILFTYELARRLEGSGVAVNAFHPGMAKTNIARGSGLMGRMGNFVLRARGVEAEKAAETGIYLASSPEVEDVTGQYFVDCRSTSSSALSYDTDLAARLWDMSEQLTATGGHG